MVNLNGDTGLSAGFKEELESIYGRPRGLPLFASLSGGGGDNADFAIVAFVGIRIVNVKLVSAMKNKGLVIQPAFVVDATAITEPGSNGSDFVYQPVRLTR
jgi:hypothetical protein